MRPECEQCCLLNSDGTISEKELGRLIKDMFMMIKEENPEEVSGQDLLTGNDNS